MTQLISMTKISSAFKPYTDKWLKVLREISDPKRGTGTARASVILLGDQAPEVKQGTHRLISDEPPAIEGSDMGRCRSLELAPGLHSGNRIL